MASKRRGGGGGFRPPELRGTLGTLLRTTTGVVRDALERGAREGRARLDGARASLDSRRAAGRRHDALADLGALLLDLIRRGEVDLDELPEARDLVRELDELDEDADDAEPEPPRAASRRRFDDRGRRDDDDDDGTVSAAAWRPERPTRPERPDRSARTERPTVPDRPEYTAPGSPKAVWRPRIDDTTPPAADAGSRVDRWNAAHTLPISRTGLGEPPRGDGERAARPSRDTAGERGDRDAADHRNRDAAPRPARDRGASQRPAPHRGDDRDRDDGSEAADRGDRRAPLPRDPTRKGGISFDDEDLADYMHPDDVPPKPGSKDPGDHEA